MNDLFDQTKAKIGQYAIDNKEVKKSVSRERSSR